jgi:Protein of unknown function (DUF3052)
VTDRQAGYSGTPLARKLGIKPGFRLALCAAPAGWTIPELPPDVTIRALPEPSSAPVAGQAASPSDPVDLVVAFCRGGQDLTAAVAGFGPLIHPAGTLWIAWPRRAAGHRSDITDNLIRDTALPLGLVDTKVAALDTDWSALKLVWRKERR